MAKFEIRLASLSDAGRRQSNEDALACSQHEGVCFAVLADGAGGHQGGAIASNQVVALLKSMLETRHTNPTTRLRPDELTRLIRHAHRRLQQAQQDSRGFARMHTTVVTLWLNAQTGQALWSHVGDSRLYRLRYGVIDHITSDDSIVQQMVRSGLMSAEQALTHPARHQLLSALGIDDEVAPHTLPEATDIEDGDVFLLCSDGWWEPLGDERITRLCREAETPQAWLESMQREIIAKNLRHQDNYSAIALWVNDPTEDTRSPEG